MFESRIHEARRPSRESCWPWLLLLWILTLHMGCGEQDPSQGSNTDPYGGDRPEMPEFVPGEVIVKMKKGPGMSEALPENDLRALGLVRRSTPAPAMGVSPTRI